MKPIKYVHRCEVNSYIYKIMEYKHPAEKCMMIISCVSYMQYIRQAVRTQGSCSCIKLKRHVSRSPTKARNATQKGPNLTRPESLVECTDELAYSDRHLPPLAEE